MLFSTAELFVTVTLFIYHLVISHTNTAVFTLKLPSGAQSKCTTQIIFLLNTMNQNVASNLHSQGTIEQEYLSKNEKKSVSEAFNKNVNFSTGFQC